MPLEGEHRAELLTAYLDGELDDTERVSVDDQLATDESLRTELAVLEEHQRGLRSHFKSSQVAPSADLKHNILAMIAAEQSAESQQAFDSAESLESPDSLKPANATPATYDGPRLGWVAAIAALAACLMLAAAIFSEQLFPPGDVQIGQQDSQDDGPRGENLADNADRESAGGDPGTEDLPNLQDLLPGSDEKPQYVSQINFKGLYYVLVVDVVVADEAMRKDLVGQLLAQARLQETPPIVLDDETAEKIAESRMNVSEDDSPDNASLYFLRASIDQLSHVLDTMYLDEANFPEIAFDIAVDNDQVRVMEAVAKSTGTRFAVSDPFAAPVSVEGRNVKDSRFSSARPERLVSKEMRTSGVGDIPSPINAGDLSTVMLIVRQQEL